MQGSEDQLKEVWQEADGLDPEDFDPKTFFKMHGNHRPYTEGRLRAKNEYSIQMLSYLLMCQNYGWLKSDTDFRCLFCVADSNGDGFFDESELEALFTKEVYVLCLTLVLHSLR